MNHNGGTALEESVEGSNRFNEYLTLTLVVHKALKLFASRGDFLTHQYNIHIKKQPYELMLRFSETGVFFWKNEHVNTQAFSIIQNDSAGTPYLDGLQIQASGTYYLFAQVHVNGRTDARRYTILSEKCIATPNCFAPYLVNVATMEYCYICLETGFISKTMLEKC